MRDDLSDWTDAQLIHGCRRGLAAAWHALVGRYQRLVYTVPRRAGLQSEDAADVFQATFSSLFENLAAIEQPERVQAWLVTTARRETLRVLQRSTRHLRLDTVGAHAGPGEIDAGELADAGAVLPPEQLAALQAQDRVRRALQGLDSRSRELLTYLYLVEPALGYGEIAERMGMAEGSIGPTRARALGKLKRLWESLE